MTQRILRQPRVSDITGLPRSTIYQRIAEGTFPRPVPLGGRKVGWLESEIIAWQREREAERDTPANPTKPPSTQRPKRREAA